MKVSGNPKIVKELSFKSSSEKDEIIIRTGDFIRIVKKPFFKTPEPIEDRTYEGRFVDVSYDEHIYAGEDGFEDGIVIQYLNQDGEPFTEDELGDEFDGYEEILFDEIDEVERL